VRESIVRQSLLLPSGEVAEEAAISIRSHARAVGSGEPPLPVEVRATLAGFRHLEFAVAPGDLDRIPPQTFEPWWSRHSFATRR
jgi:hypothetical protein